MEESELVQILFERSGPSLIACPDPPWSHRIYYVLNGKRHWVPSAAHLPLTPTNGSCGKSPPRGSADRASSSVVALTLFPYRSVAKSSSPISPPYRFPPTGITATFTFARSNSPTFTAAPFPSTAFRNSGSSHAVASTSSHA